MYNLFLRPFDYLIYNHAMETKNYSPQTLFNSKYCIDPSKYNMIYQFLIFKSILLNKLISEKKIY